MPIVDPVSQAKEMEKEVAKYDKLKKDFFDALFSAAKKNGDAYYLCVGIITQGEKEIAKARKELAECITRYDECVKQANTNREVMRQVGRGLEEAMKRLDPLDKDIRDAADGGEKMLKINKNHAALTAALAACAKTRKEVTRVSDKASQVAEECRGLRAFEPIGR